MKRLLIVCGISIAAAGCTSVQVAPEAALDPLAPLVCANKPECDAWWSRAQVWIASNSKWKIRTSNASVIRTYGPAVSRADTAYTITRTPRPDGSAEIRFDPRCEISAGCNPTRNDATLEFARYIRAEVPGARSVAPTAKP